MDSHTNEDGSVGLPTRSALSDDQITWKSLGELPDFISLFESRPPPPLSVGIPHDRSSDYNSLEAVPSLQDNDGSSIRESEDYEFIPSSELELQHVGHVFNITQDASPEPIHLTLPGCDGSFSRHCISDTAAIDPRLTILSNRQAYSDPDGANFDEQYQPQMKEPAEQLNNQDAQELLISTVHSTTPVLLPRWEASEPAPGAVNSWNVGTFAPSSTDERFDSKKRRRGDGQTLEDLSEIFLMRSVRESLNSSLEPGAQLTKCGVNILIDKMSSLRDVLIRNFETFPEEEDEFRKLQEQARVFNYLENAWNTPCRPYSVKGRNGYWPLRCAYNCGAAWLAQCKYEWLRHHSGGRQPQNIFLCSTCDSICSRKHKLQEHLAIVHKKSKEDALIESDTAIKYHVATYCEAANKPLPSQYTDCPFCNHTSSNWSELYGKHIYNHLIPHLPDEIADQKGIDPDRDYTRDADDPSRSHQNPLWRSNSGLDQGYGPAQNHSYLGPSGYKFASSTGHRIDEHSNNGSTQLQLRPKYRLQILRREVLFQYLNPILEAGRFSVMRNVNPPTDSRQQVLFLGNPFSDSHALGTSESLTSWIICTARDSLMVNSTQTSALLKHVLYPLILKSQTVDKTAFKNLAKSWCTLQKVKKSTLPAASNKYNPMSMSNSNFSTQSQEATHTDDDVAPHNHDYLDPVRSESLHFPLVATERRRMQKNRQTSDEARQRFPCMYGWCEYSAKESGFPKFLDLKMHVDRYHGELDVSSVPASSNTPDFFDIRYHQNSQYSPCIYCGTLFLLEHSFCVCCGTPTSSRDREVSPALLYYKFRQLYWSILDHSFDMQSAPNRRAKFDILRAATMRSLRHLSQLLFNVSCSFSAMTYNDNNGSFTVLEQFLDDVQAMDQILGRYLKEVHEELSNISSHDTKEDIEFLLNYGLNKQIRRLEHWAAPQSMLWKTARVATLGLDMIDSKPVLSTDFCTELERAFIDAKFTRPVLQQIKGRIGKPSAKKSERACKISPDPRWTDDPQIPWNCLR